jgi:hypothetical protein
MEGLGEMDETVFDYDCSGDGNFIADVADAR